MIVYFFIADAFEVPAESEPFHPSEECWVMGEHVFKGAVPFARLANQNSASFLYDLRFDYSRSVSEIRDTGFAANHCVCSLSIAIRT
jgi:hypothetical protein